MTPRIENQSRIDVLDVMLLAECSMHFIAGADGKVVRDVAKASRWAADIRQARVAVAALIAEVSSFANRVAAQKDEVEDYDALIRALRNCGVDA